MFEIPAGGRRYRALETLVKQKRMTKTTPVPCVVRERGDTTAEEDSLAENAQRVNLHPLDQFRSFQTLRGQGLGEEEIAARFFATPATVKQRLRLAAVSERLLDIYAEDGMTLEQLMAFTVTDDYARQEQVWDGLAQGFNKKPYTIRRLLIRRRHPRPDEGAKPRIVLVTIDSPFHLNHRIERENLDPTTLFDEGRAQGFDEGWAEKKSEGKTVMRGAGKFAAVRNSARACL